MTGLKKLIDEVIQGRSDANIRFDDLRKLLLNLNFEERIRGSHHVFTRKEVEEQVVIQKDGSKAKPYQVKQIRNIILKHRLYLT